MRNNKNGYYFYLVKPLPSRKSNRPKSFIDYSELNGDVVRDEHKYTKILASHEFESHSFQIKIGSDITLDWIRQSGMREPVIIENPIGLEMKMPSSTLTV